jgi:hypothetical protein
MGVMEIVSESRRNSMTPEFTVTAEVPVTYEMICNAFVGVCEGPYSPWLHGFNYTPESEALATASRGGEHTVWYNDPAFWVGGGKAALEFDRAEDHEGANKGRMVIGMDEIKDGLAKMAVRAPRHFSDLINESDDAITHDVMVQCIVFGEIIYG